PVQHRNVDDGYYSWIDTLEGGYCCGYADGEADKSSDVGLIKDLLPPEGSEQDIVVDAYLCLPSQSSETGEFGDENIVGHTLADGEIEHPGWKEAGCDGGGIYSPKDWCWLPAASKPFRIMSINDPDEDAPYDVVSNNERWVECRATDENSDPTGPNSISTDVSSSDYIEEANRFYCFDEGNRWSWAECLSETSPDETALSNNVAKTRVAGDGLFGLTLKRPSIHSAEVDMDHYHDYYGDTIVSAEGYTHLEFMVKYTDEVKFPARLLLTISGPAEDRNDDENIMRKNVLGDITNNAYLTPGEWYHIKTKIPDGLQSIKSLTIASIPITNTIEVKNIYFSKEGDTPLCSGIGSDLNPTHLDISEEQASSWITDIDHYDPNSFLNGEDLCNALYDPEAKLAWIEENEELDIDAMCCGNDQGEYASGNVRGCWNSVVVEDQQSVGNVEINVQYKEKEYDIDYIGYYPYDLEFEYEFVGTISEADKEVYITSFNTFNRENFKFYYEGDVENRYPVVQFWACFFRGVVTPYCNTGLDVVLSSITIKDTLNLNLEMEAKDNNDNWVVLANNKLILSSFGEEEYIDIRIVPTEKLDANRAQSKYFLRATELPMVPITDEALTKKTFTCTSNECVFPLPGESDPAEEAIDYTITNNNPGMYDLYLVLGPGLKDEILLSEQTTEIDIDPLYDRFNSEDSIGAPAANLRVKRVPQNVVYVKDTDPDYPDKFHYQFYGCNAGLQEQSTLSDQEYNDLLFCDVKGEYFCSFSETEPHPEEADDIPYLTTIGTWSKQTLPEFGYKPVPEDTTVENMDERLELRAPEGEQETESKNRNMPSPILPGRNILPNPYFTEIKPPELLYWDIFDLVGDGLYQKVETENRHPQDIPESELSEEETIIPRSIPLTATQMLLSDRIAIPQGATLRFSYEGSCDDVQAILYDTSNPSATAPTKITLNAAGTSFNTGTNSYVSFQFSGSCTIQYPLLQLDDGKGIAEFSYNLRYPSKQKPRAAAACCPTNYCWNGFTCVEPMTDDTLIAEHVGEDRNYRCIEGSWVELPLLSDWNAEKQGFCSFENQCFILSSRNTEIIDTEDKIIAEMPKEGSEQINFHQQTEITGVKFPTCINDSEFVLDHYCDQGDWTSRTKFLAGQLLEEAGSSDYSIYCSDPKAVLADFDGKEQQILGGGEGATLPSDSLIPGSVPSATSASCFPLPADPVAERLIPPEDNTCINSACILKHEAGNVIFATTLNKPINDDDSLLRAFDQHPSICGDDGVCATTESFVGELQYVPGINALIYGRDGISRPLSFVVFKDKVFDFLSDFFGREETLSSTLQFVQEADNFRDIYLLKADGKEVQAVKEVLPKTSPSSVSKHSIIADYTGFESPICAFLNARHLGSAWPADLLEPEKVNCVTIDDTQRVEISVTPGKKNLLNQIWPQLTGKLRPEVAG
ncbi:MAG TPA: hypothetical protein VJI15_06435, partial [Candidatus Nanoarchaeia archaeon]|nr:hypothetical protein [Candidatus Nanoarchaeia archaeon]